MKENRF